MCIISFDSYKFVIYRRKYHPSYFKYEKETEP